MNLFLQSIGENPQVLFQLIGLWVVVATFVIACAIGTARGSDRSTSERLRRISRDRRTARSARFAR